MIKNEPMYDTDEINFGYLKKVIESLNKSADIIQKSIEKEINKNYGRQPIPPYKEGDTWTTVNYIYRCIKSREIGSFNISDWVIIYDKKRNDLMTDNFLFLSEVELKEQQDGKIETYYMTDDPSINWPLLTDKSLHVGDFWRKDEDSIINDYVYTQIATNPVSYDWIKINLPIIVYNVITNHKTIYLVPPNTYKKDDLWKISSEEQKELFHNVEIGDYLICKNDSDNFYVSDWEKLNDELSLKSVESYYLRITEVKKEIKNLNEIIKKDIKETKDAMTLFVEHTYTKQTTTQKLEEKVNANGEVIDEIVGETTEEIPFKSLAALTLDLANITLEVSKKVGDDEIISKINQTAEEVAILASKIKLEGIVTANGNFQILEDGSMKTKNGSFTGNIYLNDGSKVVGGDGLLTNLNFSSYFTGIGWYNEGLNDYKKHGATLFYSIPNNFKVLEAYCMISLYPSKLEYYQDGTFYQNGYCRNLQLYKAQDLSNVRFDSYADAQADPDFETLKKSVISGALGNTNGYTAPADKSVVFKSNNIKDYILSGENGLLFLETQDDAKTIKSMQDMASKTAFGNFTLVVLGYMQLG